MKKFLMSLDWIGMFLYGLFGWLLAFGGIGVLTQPFVFLGLLAILMVVDIRSHTIGLNKGADIVKEVWYLK